MIQTVCSLPPPPSAALPSSLLGAPLTPHEYVHVWSVLCAQHRATFTPPPNTSPIQQPTAGMGGGSATLLGFGHASHRRFNLGILIPTFSLSKKFSSKHSLIQRRGVDAAPQGSNGGKWRPEDAWSEKMATVPGRKGRLSKAQVDFMLASLVEQAGKAMASGNRVELELGVGVLECENCEVHLRFSQVGTAPEVSPRTRRVGETSEVEAMRKKMQLELVNLPEAMASSLTFTAPDSGSAPRSKSPSKLDRAATLSWEPRFQPSAQPAQADRAPSPAGSEDGSQANNPASASPALPDTSLPPPPLLDAFARLACATVSGDPDVSGASNKIGSYYSPSAASLHLDKETGRVKGAKGKGSAGREGEGDDGDVFGMKALRREREALERDGDGEAEEEADAAAPAAPQLSAAGATRYMQYLSPAFLSSVPTQPFPAPLQTSLSSRFHSSHTDKVELGIAEVEALWERAIVKSTLDYALLNAEERDRLGIEEIPADVKVGGFGWGGGKLFLRSPGVWRETFRSTRSYFKKHSIIATPITIANALWQDFEHLRLVAVPGDYKSSLATGNETFTVLQFEKAQMNHMNTVVDEFRNNWAVNLKNVFEETIEDGDYLVEEHLMARYTDAMTVVMQTHLRTVVTKSIELFVDFFEMFSVDGGRVETRTAPEGSSLAYTRPPAPFIIDLMLNPNSNASFFNELPVKLTTSLDQVCSRVLNVFDNMVRSFENFDAVRASTRTGVMRKLSAIDPREELVSKARHRIVEVIEGNMALCMQSLSVYEPFGYLLHNDHMDQLDHNGEAKLEEVDAVIMRVEKSAEELRALPSSIPLVLVQLTSSGLHASFYKIAEHSTRVAIEKVVSECMSLNNTTHKSGRMLWSKLNKKPTNTDELIETERFLDEVKMVELPALEKEVNGVKDQVTFLYEHNCLHGDTLDTVNSTYRQLGELHAQFERATAIAHNERTSFENNCKSTKRALTTQLTTIEEMVDKYRFKCDVKSMVQKYLEELDSLTAQVDASKLKASVINQEENKLGWVPTEFKKITEIEDKIEPFKDLWNIALSFRSEYASWTRSPLFKLEGGEVATSHTSMSVRLEKLKETFEDNEAEGPAGVADQILETLNGFQKYIPFLKALTNPRLDLHHWKRISDILGFEISPEDKSVNWSNLNDQGALSQDNIDSIAELSNQANREYDRVVFGDWMAGMEEDIKKSKVALVVETNHPWVVGGSCFEISKLDLEKTLFAFDTHVKNCASIIESENGEELAEQCEEYKEAFAKAAKFGSLFLETHVLWHGLVFQKNAHERDTSHQVSQADEQWRGILEEVKEAEEKKEAGEGAEEDAPLAAADADGRALVHGCAYTALSHFPALHERSVEVRDIFKAVRKGEDTRKLMRRMSRRQSNMQKATNHALSASLQHAK
ncbi:hypothetical protein TeGR_g1942 [Tetraparma gracilis]|uniref:Dynein heavy chain linker domain-containing protein n=1 Tax=Tetraparma gracilis TaxID=2962635 RepID=A0ABQ6MDK3_9STRA|nr:hypothetical protein TeGR_g1942 [Tetraparma gracilis]